MSLMRFFTPEWLAGDLDDEDFERAGALYEQRLSEIRVSLPTSVRQFVSDVSLHDGLVRRAEADTDRFRLVVRVGDLQRGYSDLDVRYSNVQFLRGIPSTEDALNSHEEIVCDEFDVAENSIEHRLLFASGEEFLVRFQDLDFHVTPVERRDFERFDFVFVDRR